MLGMTTFWPGGCAIEAAEAIPAYNSLLDSVFQGSAKPTNKKGQRHKGYVDGFVSLWWILFSNPIDGLMLDVGSEGIWGAE